VRSAYDRGVSRAAVGSLLAAAHLGPTVVVTATATTLAAMLEAGTRTTVLVALAFLAGQLSIGWSNDWVDAARDTATGRRDKPIAQEAVSPTTVGRAAGFAAAAAVPLSLALGLPAGVAHLVLVGAGWAYNLGLKATVWSWLPYAVALACCPPSSCWRCRVIHRHLSGSWASGRCSVQALTWSTYCRTWKTTGRQGCEVSHTAWAGRAPSRWLRPSWWPARLSRWWAHRAARPGYAVAVLAATVVRPRWPVSRPSWVDGCCRSSRSPLSPSSTWSCLLVGADPTA
jgi:hypothetical protein